MSKSILEKVNKWQINIADINECDNSPCQNGGTCNNAQGGYSCACTKFWTGQDCTQGK